jgi:hypothetical protein
MGGLPRCIQKLTIICLIIQCSAIEHGGFLLLLAYLSTIPIVMVFYFLFRLASIMTLQFNVPMHATTV